MKIDFDPIKNEKNIRERGLSFERAAEVDFRKANEREATRYGKAQTID
jgi:uncharacterized protein